MERRLQSQPESVSDSELLSAAEKVDMLKTLVPPMTSRSGTWDVFYRKYSALLHPYLQARSLRLYAPTPPIWDSNNALDGLVAHFKESEHKLQTVTFVSDLYRVVERLQSGEQVSDQILQSLLSQMEDKADSVLDLAIEHPQLPAQFNKVRQRLWDLLEIREQEKSRR